MCDSGVGYSGPTKVMFQWAQMDRCRIACFGPLLIAPTRAALGLLEFIQRVSFRSQTLRADLQ
jgi:hypothetical protein